MRVLIVGTVPPPGGEVAKALGAIAAERLEHGDEVEILSPDLRSAAHRHARLSGLWLMLQLVRGAHRFDELVLRIEKDVPLRAEANRFSRALSLIGLGLALRLYRTVTLRLDSPIPIPGGLGGRATRAFWSQATTIVVSPDDAAQLRIVPGVDADQVVIEEPKIATVPPIVEGWGIDPSGDVRTQVMALVRERAKTDRKIDRARASIAPAAAISLSGEVFDGARPPAPSVVAFVRFGLARARRAGSNRLARADSR